MGMVWVTGCRVYRGSNRKCAGVSFKSQVYYDAVFDFIAFFRNPTCSVLTCSFPCAVECSLSCIYNNADEMRSFK